MENIKSKSELIQKIKSRRRELEKIVNSVPGDRISEPGVENGWSVKDIMAHISKWERMMCEWVANLQAGRIPDRPPPGEPWEDLDQFNAAIFEENRDKTISSVRSEFESSYNDTLELVENSWERDLIEPGRFGWAKNNPLWYLVGANTFWHYEEHIPSIRGWMEKQND